MSELTFAEPQRVNTQPSAAKETVLPERREPNPLEATTLQQWRLDTLTGTFAEPRIGFDFSRVAPYSISESVPGPAEPITGLTEPDETAGFIMEDSAEELGSGQMKKGEFLARLRAEVTRTVDAALVSVGRDTEGCPYLEYWFDFYGRQDSAHVERAIRKYAPETARAATAGEYIPIIAKRAGRAAEIWARTGEITGIPEGLSIGLPVTGIPGGVFPGISRVFFKARNGGARRPDGPRTIQAELGEGQALDSDVRSRMETAFGMDFSHVRAHTDSTAAGLSNHYNARAFTVGHHVAFGANEYKPGTLVGDALIAHELAHVAQQEASESPVSTKEVDSDNYNALENDADISAVGVLSFLWGGLKAVISGLDKKNKPHLQSGLKLQRCSHVFSELSSQRYQGYDSSTSPNGLVVPVGGSRDVMLRRSSTTMSLDSDNPGIASITESQQTMAVRGIAHGPATIAAREQGRVVEQLNVSVKNRIEKTVDYHYISDIAGHTTSHSQGDEVNMTNTLNYIWERQANIHFRTGIVDTQRIQSDLGPVITCPNNQTPACLAIGRYETGGDYNIFLVWSFTTNAPGAGEVLAGTASGITLLSDAAHNDCFTIAHEAGHYLGLYRPPAMHPHEGLMSECGEGSEPQRVFKAEADIVNP